MITGNQELIRDMNRRLVLETILHNEPMSRAGLAKKLKLTKATISAIVQELIDKQLLMEIGSKNTTMGRKPILLDFNKECGYVISIDVALDKISVMTSDLKGENCVVKEHPRKQSTLTVEEITEIIDRTLLLLENRVYGVVGICLGIHGVVHKNQILFTPYYEVENINIHQALTEKYPFPVFIENEANLCVLGESAYHYTQKNIIYINIHEGIGMGILLDGKLFKGKDGYAGEVGHTILYPNGKKCPCGNYGCLEQYASEKAILESYASQKKYAFVTIEKFIRDYLNHDPLAMELIDSFTTYMAIGINNILNTFNPDLIILNSSFSNYIPGTCSHIQEKIKNQLGKQFTIVTGELQDISELLGGVFLCVQGFLDSHSQIF